MIRRVAVLLGALVTACAGPPPPLPAASTAAPPRACHAEPDPGPLMTERGIGGTGVTPAGPDLAERGIGGTGISGTGITPAGPRLAERGIGGTGVTPAGHRSAERGIGGTGIVGVVTGFASICVDGLEVALDGTAAVEVDGDRAAAALLRAGQVVAIAAEGPEAELHARTIAVRHEVSGPVEAIDLGGGEVLTVAGQPVAMLPTTRGHTDILPGDWIAVSGLRTPEGTILATRADRRPPGRVTVHGTLAGSSRDGWRIGTLKLRLPPGPPPAAGTAVAAAGHYASGLLAVETLAPDLLAANPPAYFGDTVGRMVIESFARFEAGRVRLSGGYEASAGARIAAVLARPGPAVVSLEREAGAFRVNNILGAGGHIAVPQAFPWIGPAANPLLGLGRDSDAGGREHGGEGGPEPGGGEIHPAAEPAGPGGPPGIPTESPQLLSPAQEGRSGGAKGPPHGGHGN